MSYRYHIQLRLLLLQILAHKLVQLRHVEHVIKQDSVLCLSQTQEKEREERVWRERLQRCQRQLKAKEEEMSRQAQYFENFKTQLQHKLSLAWEREESLQNRIYTLEKQLLDMTVSAATGMTTIRAVRITGGTVQCLEEQDGLSSMRGEGEGEEETKEERRKKWQPSVGTEREERRKGDEGKAENSIGGGRNSDTKQSSNEARLQGFIVSLQEDLRVLLEREEERMTERKRLMEQLQEAQESNHFLSCSVDEMKSEIQQLKLSENSQLEELEHLREENLRLQQVLRDSANHIPSQSSACLSPETSTPNSSLAVNSGTANIFSYSTATGQPSVACSGEVCRIQLVLIFNIINIILTVCLSVCLSIIYYYNNNLIR